MQADVRAALDKRDHKRLRVLLQQCSGQELAAMRSPLPLYHSVAGSGWAVGTVMLAWAAMPVPAADEEIAVLYSLLPRPPPDCQQHEFGSHTALSFACAATSTTFKSWFPKHYGTTMQPSLSASTSRLLRCWICQGIWLK
jgi:hypothetical protein